MVATVIPIMLLFLMLAVMVYDATRYIIPNWLNLAVLLLYPLWVMTAPVEVDWALGLAMALLYLVFGFGLFALGVLGAGDAKLMTVLGLFLGWSLTSAEFVIYMCLLGGLMSLFIVTVRRFLKYSDKPKPRIFTPKQPAPYGIAIALSFIWVLLNGSIAGMAVPF